MLVGVIRNPSPSRTLMLPEVPWLMPSAFIDRQASMMLWRFSLAASLSMVRSISFVATGFRLGGSRHFLRRGGGRRQASGFAPPIRLIGAPLD